MTIQTNKTLGGVSACLTLVGAVGTVLTAFQTLSAPTSTVSTLGLLGVAGIFGALGFVAFILFLVAMSGFSHDYSDKRIFGYITSGLLYTIVLAVIVGVLWFVFVLIATLGAPHSSLPSSAELNSLYSPLGAIMSVITLIWIYYNFKAYNLLADKSSVHQFRIAAKIFVAGAIVNIAVGAVLAALAFSGLIGYSILLLASLPGSIVMYVAWGYVAKGFFSIQAPPQQIFTQPTVPPNSLQVKYCPKCGAQNRIDSAYCDRCGQKLPLS